MDGSACVAIKFSTEVLYSQLKMALCTKPITPSATDGTPRIEPRPEDPRTASHSGSNTMISIALLAIAFVLGHYAPAKQIIKLRSTSSRMSAGHRGVPSTQTTAAVRSVGLVRQRWRGGNLVNPSSAARQKGRRSRCSMRGNQPKTIVIEPVSKGVRRPCMSCTLRPGWKPTFGGRVRGGHPCRVSRRLGVLVWKRRFLLRRSGFSIRMLCVGEPCLLSCRADCLSVLETQTVLDGMEDGLAVLVMLGMSMRTHDSTILRSVGKRSNSKVINIVDTRARTTNAMTLDHFTLKSLLESCVGGMVIIVVAGDYFCRVIEHRKPVCNAW